MDKALLMVPYGKRVRICYWYDLGALTGPVARHPRWRIPHSFAFTMRLSYGDPKNNITVPYLVRFELLMHPQHTDIPLMMVTDENNRYFKYGLSGIRSNDETIKQVHQFMHYTLSCRARVYT